jgi:archaemetzincin
VKNRTFLCVAIAGFLAIACTNTEKKTENPVDFTRGLEQLDVKLSEPKPGEWLYEHKEAGQTFEQYKLSSPVSPDGDRKKIYLLPIGEFLPIEDSIVNYTADYLAIFFGLETIIAPAISDKIIPSNARRRREDGHEQLLTKYILENILPARIPDDAIVVMAVTAKDLYPSESWNYVFGQATIKKRVGVSSIYRFSMPDMDTMTYPVCLERLIKTSSHEIGHMFSIQHCTYGVCVMNGSNSLWESDTRPNRLCSDCLNKLTWNLGFSVRERFSGLEKFFKQHKLVADANLASSDFGVVQKNYK